jgi:hypothetical protein
VSTELDRIEERAQRQLDGMTVNRDAMARDVLKLCKAIRRVTSETAKPGKPAPANRHAVIDEVFGNLFGDA